MREAALFKSVIDKQTSGARWEGKLSVLTGLSRGIIPSPRRVNIYLRPVTNKTDVYGPSMEKEGIHFSLSFSLSHTRDGNKNKESERNLIEYEKIGSLCCVSSSERKQGDRRTQRLRIGKRLENWPGKIRSTSIWCDKLTFIQFLQIFFQLSGQKLVKQRGLDPVNPVYFIQFYSYKLKIQFNLDVRRCYKTMFEIRLNGEILMTRGWQRMQ